MDAGPATRHVMHYMSPWYDDAMRYFEEKVFDDYLQVGVEKGSTLYDRKWPKDKILEHGKDRFWGYLVHRELIRKGIKLSAWEEEEIEVLEGGGVIVPYYMWHGGGVHLLSDDDSIRMHIYVNNRDVISGQRMEGKIYDARGDKVVAPLMRYFMANQEVVTVNYYCQV